MSQVYSDPARESDPHALPDAEVFQLTAAEVAERDEDAVMEALKRFPLAAMNSRERQRAIDWIVESYEIKGGWFYWYCFPGCLPDSDPIGPFKTGEEALEELRKENEP